MGGSDLLWRRVASVAVGGWRCVARAPRGPAQLPLAFAFICRLVPGGNWDGEGSSASAAGCCGAVLVGGH